MNLLITGGAGFIGRRLVDACVRDASIDDIVVLDDGSFGDLDELRSLPISLIEASVLDRDALDHAVGGADVVVHLAARWADGAAIADPLGVHEVNTMGTLRLFDAAERSHRPHLVLCATALQSETPRDAVDAATVAVRAAAASARQTSGLSIAEVELPAVIGHGRPWGHPRGAWVDIAIRAALDERAVEVTTHQVQQVIEVGHAAELLRTELRSPKSATIRVEGHPLSELEVIAHASRITGSPITITAGPHDGRDLWLRPTTPPSLGDALDEMIRSALDDAVI